MNRKKVGALERVKFSDSDIPDKKIDRRTKRMQTRVNEVLQLIKEKDRTKNDLVLELGYAERSIFYYLVILRRKKLISKMECPHCGILGMFYHYIGKK